VTCGRDLPSVVACLGNDFEACIADLRFPLGHRRAIRPLNLLARLFGEERGCTKVIPHAFGARGLETHAYGLDPRRRTLARDQRDRVRAASVEGDPR